MVVSNPPYIGTGEELPPVVADWEPPVALWSGPAGHEAVEQVIGGASQVAACRAGRWFWRWHRTGLRSLRASAAATGFADVRVERDLAGLERVVIGRLP